MNSTLIDSIIPLFQATDTRLAALALCLVLARMLGLVWLAPGWALAGIGWRVRVALAAMLSLVLAPTAAGSIVAIAESRWDQMVFAFGAELAIGAALGIGASLLVAAARQAGDLVAMQAGLSPASLIDIEPDAGLFGEAGESATPLGHIHGLLALAVFLGLNGPLWMVDALAASLRSLPPGALAELSVANATSAHGSRIVADLFGQVSSALGLALRAAMPAGLALMLAGLVMAVASRGGPARMLNGITWPLRWLVGLLLVMLTLGGVCATFATAWRGWAAVHAGG